ncbi:P27 family phage terminase small subunit [Lutibacter aestuarii]|uniref:P27 family phage terminase small subunit n=1 Tax=Lutibacter aestuarii TaxID=861111 RepID=A0ABW2ZB75_9FLAO
MKDSKMEIVHSSSGSVKKDATLEEKQLYEILEKLPSPKNEMNLTKDQRKWWYWFGKQFLTTKQFTQLDLMHLQTAAVSMDKRSKIIAKINKLNLLDKEDGVAGWVQVFENKTNNVTGYSTVYKQATEELDKVSAHFGLSIKDRQKLKVTEADNGQLSLWDKVLEQLKPAQ